MSENIFWARPASPAVASGDLDEALADVGNLEYERAAGKLAGLATRFAEAGDRHQAAKALFWLSYCYEKTGRKNQAEVFYQQVIRKYPETPAARQARGRLARLEIKRPGRDKKDTSTRRRR